eukprot:gene5934-11971_t
MLVLVPKFHPPPPKTLFRQSCYDRINTLTSLIPKTTDFPVKLGHSSTLSTDSSSSSVTINNTDDSNISHRKNSALQHQAGISLFDGAISHLSTPSSNQQKSQRNSSTTSNSTLTQPITSTSTASSQQNISTHTTKEQSLSNAMKSVNSMPISSNTNNQKQQSSKRKISDANNTSTQESSSSTKHMKPSTHQTQTHLIATDTLTSTPTSTHTHTPMLTLSTTHHHTTTTTSSDINFIKSSDFNGISSFCRNAGTSKEGLEALLHKCNSTNKIILSCIWHDMTSNHCTSSMKYCTPSTDCYRWNCTCDRHIRVQQGYQPLVGVLIYFPEIEEDIDFVYYLPLSACSDEWHPIYESRSLQNFTLPLQCETSLENRFEILFDILASDAMKVIFQSNLFLLPILAAYEDLLKLKLKLKCKDSHSTQWSTLPVQNMFDPRVAAHLTDSDLSEKQLELDALFNRFDISLPSQFTRGHITTGTDTMGSGTGSGYGSMGQLSHVMRTNMQEMKLLYRLNEKLLKYLEDAGSFTVFEKIEMPLVRILVDMELRGITISIEDMNNILNTVTTEIRITIDKANRMVHFPLNMASPDQVATLLYDTLKLPSPAISGGQRHASTSEDDLLKIKDAHPVVPLILHFRALSKINSTYIEGIQPFLSTAIATATASKIHASWNQSAVRTGRLSCSKPNLQNIPKPGKDSITNSNSNSSSSINDGDGNVVDIMPMSINIRGMFHASPNCILVGADYSQIEMRILAHITRDAEMTKLFGHEGDIYRHLAGQILRKTPETVDKVERERAKTICLGVIYGMGPQAAAAKLGISVATVKTITEAFFDRFKAVKAWLQEIRNLARRQGFVTTLLGRRRYLPDIHSLSHTARSQAERQAVNTVIQGTASEVIKYAMLIVEKEIKEFYTSKNIEIFKNDNIIIMPKLILQIHDELIYEIHEDSMSLEDMSLLLHNAMERCVSQYLKLTVPLKVNIQYGKDWGHMDAVKL